MLSRGLDEIRNRFHRGFDGLGLKPVGFVKASTQAGLAALLQNRLGDGAVNIGYQQLNRVSADIDHSAAHVSHSKFSIDDGT